MRVRRGHQLTLDSKVELCLKRAWPHLGRQNRYIVYLSIIKGLSRQEIADLVKISFKTVAEYLWQSTVKIGAGNHRQAIAYYAVRFYQERMKILDE